MHDAQILGPDRGEADAHDRPRGGRRLTARRKLIDAGYAVMSEKGFEASSITEMIEQRAAIIAFGVILARSGAQAAA